MENMERELTPVNYNAAGVRVLQYCVEKEGTLCFRMHWHDRMELLWIHSGEMMVDFGTVRDHYGPGTLVLVHPRQPHYGVCSRGPLKYDTIMFDLRRFCSENTVSSRYLLPVFEGTVRFAQAVSGPEILRCAERIAVPDPDSSQALEVIGQIYSLFSLLYRDCLCSEAEAGAFDKVTREIIDYMEANCGEPLTEDQLCRKFGYTKPYFCRKFKENTGLSPMRYLNIYRVEKARRMLRSGARDIGQVALSCGFPDANYFSRCFKKHFGFTPSACCRQDMGQGKKKRQHS